MSRTHILLLIVTASLAVFSAKAASQSECNSYKKLPFSANAALEMDKAVENYLESLSEKDRISQIFLVNIEGNEKYFPVEKVSDIKKYFPEGDFHNDDESLVPGGVLLFSYNIGSTPEQVSAFISSITEYCLENKIVPPYVSVDQEGGLVNRLREITSPFPSEQTVSSRFNEAEALQLFTLQAKQMKSLGFNFNLSPVAEAEAAFNKDFLGNRSFGNVEKTVNYSSCEIKAFQSQKVSAAVKHFPGNTNTDPHTGLPRINLSGEDFNSQLLEPFAAILKAKPDAVLMSHATVVSSEDERPACLSHYWVTEVLRNQLNFKGLIISDDVFMAALSKNGYPPEKAAVKAIEAGVDVIMLSEKRYASAAAILMEKAASSPEFAVELHEAEKKVLQYKIKKGLLKLQKNDDMTYSVIVPAFENRAENLQEFYEAREKGRELYSSCMGR